MILKKKCFKFVQQKKQDKAVLFSCIHSSPVAFETVAFLVHAYSFTVRSFCCHFCGVDASRRPVEVLFYIRSNLTKKKKKKKERFHFLCVNLAVFTAPDVTFMTR
ncbi:hypothetical protein FQA47_011679 [Oryzias melastigma]|uniref:Uncharacterized protein n=1 Tax=Oryzias melastigma TaxID=30732 RepID=A0A834FAN8_ORYME|nr:hypothetical protein FQA47_011679 [Oryzias melastigma]